MAETPEPIELGEADILSTEPLSHTPGSPGASADTATERLQTAGVDPSAILAVVARKLRGIGPIDEATDDGHVLDYQTGGRPVQVEDPKFGIVTLNEVAAIERKATEKIRAAREAAKTHGQRVATERTIQRLRRLSGQPGQGKTRKDKLIEDLKGVRNG